MVRLRGLPYVVSLLLLLDTPYKSIQYQVYATSKYFIPGINKYYFEVLRSNTSKVTQHQYQGLVMNQGQKQRTLLVDCSASGIMLSLVLDE